MVAFKPQSANGREGSHRIRLRMSGMRAYYMDDSPADQREPHELAPSQPVSREHLAKLGVLYWYLPDAAEK